MDKKSTGIIAGIIVAALLLFGYIMYQKSSILSTEDKTPSWAEEPATTSVSNLPDRIVITAKHAYRAGEYIIAGEVPLPTACEILESAGTASADKKKVFVELMTSIKTGGTCPPKITPARFIVKVKALQSATISGTLNGREVTLNLIEAGPSENLEDFELYIKG